MSMNGKENIIAGILSAAEEEKARTLSAARTQAEEIARADEAFCASLREETEKTARETEEIELSRAAARARMDTGKLLLAAKQAEISEAFAAAERAVLALDKRQYSRFIFSLLDRWAEEGDTVVLARGDGAKIAPQDIAAYAASRGVRLSCRADGDFSGGVMLENTKYDKDLTLPMLLREYREAHEGEIAAILSGGAEK